MDINSPTRAELVEHIAWTVRNDRDWKRSTLDMLSELHRSPKWSATAARVTNGSSSSFARFLRDVERRVEEIRS